MVDAWRIDDEGSQGGVSDLDENDLLEHNPNDDLIPEVLLEENSRIISSEGEEKGKHSAILEQRGSQVSMSRLQETERLDRLAQEQGDRLKAQVQEIAVKDQEINRLRKIEDAYADKVSYARSLEQQLAEQKHQITHLQKQLLPKLLSRRENTRASFRDGTRRERAARLNQKDALELKKQAESFRNCQAEMDAEIAEVATKMTAKESDKDRLSQTTISRLEMDLEAFQGREKSLSEDVKRLFGTTQALGALFCKRDEDCKRLSLEAERLKIMLEQADYKVEALKENGAVIASGKERAKAHTDSSRTPDHVLHAEKSNLAAEPSAATARPNRALVKVDCSRTRRGHQATEKKSETAPREVEKGKGEMDGSLGGVETVNKALLGLQVSSWNGWLSVGLLFGLCLLAF